MLIEIMINKEQRVSLATQEIFQPLPCESSA